MDLQVGDLVRIVCNPKISQRCYECYGEIGVIVSINYSRIFCVVGPYGREMWSRAALELVVE